MSSTWAYIIADIAMMLLWVYFAYTRRPHTSVRTMLMLIVGIAAILHELLPNTESVGNASSIYLLIGGLLHYMSVAKYNKWLIALAHTVIIVPVVCLHFFIKDTPYEKLVKGFKYRNEKALARILDISFLPPFEMDTVYVVKSDSEPTITTARFRFTKPFDVPEYRYNVGLVKQLYAKNMHTTHDSRKHPLYLASEYTETDGCRSYSAASVDLYDAGFIVSYGEYTNQTDPAHIGDIKYIYGSVPPHTSLYRYNRYVWDKVEGEEIILLDEPFDEEDIIAMKDCCYNDASWSVEMLSDTTVLHYKTQASKKALQQTTFTLIPNMSGGCEAVHVNYHRELTNH